MDNVEQENKVEEKKIPEQIIQESTKKDPELTDKDINWKKFKEAREQERKQAEETSKRAAQKEAEAEALKAALDAVLNKNQQHQVQNNGYDEDETEDQRIEKKVNALLSQREAQAEQKRRQEEQASLPDKLKTIHKDFEHVCTTSNLDYLEYHHPELARSLGSRPDSFEKWNDIYNAVKRYIPNTETKREQMRAENNFNKPQSLSSPGVTQGGNAMPAARLDESRKADNWARMQKAMKGLS